MPALVALYKISHTYPAKGKAPAREALREVSFEVQAGETFGLVGPNGGGKSTLFRVLSTYFPPTSGKAAIFGLDIASQARDIRARLGVVFQNPSLDLKLTVRDTAGNVAVAQTSEPILIDLTEPVIDNVTVITTR